MPGATRAEPRESSMERRADRAEEPDAPEVQVPEPPPRYGPPYWYGWQVNVTDATSLAFLLTSSDERAWQLAVWIGAYGLGGPLVHAAHGRGWRALGSVGLRLGATAAGVAAFAEIDCHDRRDPDTGEEIATCADAATALVLFMYAGAVADSLIDAHDRPRLPDSPPAVSLTLAPLRRGGTVGATWRF